jgi:hypothetical protein
MQHHVAAQGPARRPAPRAGRRAHVVGRRHLLGPGLDVEPTSDDFSGASCRFPQASPRGARLGACCSTPRVTFLLARRRRWRSSPAPSSVGSGPQPGCSATIRLDEGLVAPCNHAARQRAGSKIALTPSCSSLGNRWTRPRRARGADLARAWVRGSQAALRRIYSARTRGTGAPITCRTGSNPGPSRVRGSPLHSRGWSRGRASADGGVRPVISRLTSAEDHEDEEGCGAPQGEQAGPLEGSCLAR